MNLVIESFEGGIYLAFREENEQKQIILDKHQKPLKFQSLEQAHDFYNKKGFINAKLIQSNAYDEMCGKQVGEHPPLEIDLKWH